MYQPELTHPGRMMVWQKIAFVARIMWTEIKWKLYVPQNIQPGPDQRSLAVG